MSNDLPMLPRRAFLATSCAAACLAAAGCSAGDTPSNGSGGDTSSGDTSSGDTYSGPITVPVTDVPVGGGIVLADRQVVITQPEAGLFRAFSAICTHQGCTVRRVRGGAIECPCHNSQFSITDGSVIRDPAPQPLPTRTVRRDADVLIVD